MTIQEEIKRQKEIIEAVVDKRFVIFHQDYWKEEHFNFLANANTCWPRVLEALEVANLSLKDLCSCQDDLSMQEFEDGDRCFPCTAIKEIEQILKGEEGE